MRKGFSLSFAIFLLLNNSLLCVDAITSASPTLKPSFPAKKIQEQRLTVSPKEAEILSKVKDLSSTDLDVAIQFLKEKITPESSAVLDFTLGNLYFQKEELKEAEDSYRKALKKFPHFIEARSNLAKTLLKRGEIDKALKEFSLLLKEGVKDTEILQLMGYAFLSKGDAISAETCYKEILLLSPENDNAYKGLAQCLLQQERYKEMIGIVKNFLKKNPMDKEMWFLLSNAYIAMGDCKKAIITLECTRRLKIINQDGLSTLGELYLTQGQPAEALEVYQELMVMGKPPIPRLLRAVEGFIMLNRLEEAETLIQEVDTHKYSLLPAQENKLKRLKAEIAYLKGDYQESLILYKEILKEEPLDGDALIAIGDIYYKLSKLEEALIFYERAGRIKEKEVEALIRQAQVEVERENYKRAVELLESAQSIKFQPYIDRYLEQIHNLIELTQIK